MRSRLNTAALAVLVAALALGALVYFLADDTAANAALDEMYGSKTYLRELQRFGGKSSVLFDEFQRWFAGLWQGKALGITIGWLGALVSGGLFFAASRSKE
jgi:hypothetical protein